MQIAIVWEGDSPSESRTLTYCELLEEVCSYIVLRYGTVMQLIRIGVSLGELHEEHRFAEGRYCFYLSSDGPRGRCSNVGLRPSGTSPQVRLLTLAFPRPRR